MRVVGVTVSNTGSSLCPYCGEYLEAVSGLDLGGGMMKPAPGDYTICGFCGGILRFDINLQARGVKPEVAKDYIEHLSPELQEMQRALAAGEGPFKRKKGTKQ
jgi:hypothetical protein